MKILALVPGITATALLGALAAATHPSVIGAVALATAAVLCGALVLLLVCAPGGTDADGAVGGLPNQATPLREWMRSGELGHEEVVRLLDHLDRMGPHPNLSTRSAAEMVRYRRLSTVRFAQYVDRRLDEIEGPA